MNKKLRIVATILVIMMLFTSCGGSKDSNVKDDYSYVSNTGSHYSGMGNSYEAPNDYASSNKNDYNVDISSTSAPSSRKIIYTAHLGIETLEFDKSYDAIKEAVAKFGGYISSSSLYGGQSYFSEGTNRYLSLTIRVPSANYNAFLNEKEGFGITNSFSENTEDITSSYLDVESRLSSLRTQKDRLLELAKKAASVSELLEIENSLSDVIYQIEYYQAQLNSYDDLIDYCTVYLNLSEVNAISTVNTGFLYKLKDTFGSSWINLLNFLQDVVLYIVSILPFVLLALCFYPLVRMIYKKLKARADKKTQERMAKFAPKGNKEEENK